MIMKKRKFHEGKREENQVNIEKHPEINFLDGKLNLYFSFDEEAIQYLPEVTDEDLQSLQEKYRILLGNSEIINENTININIKGILEADPTIEKNLFYSEGKKHVSPNLPVITQWVEVIKKTNKEYKNFNFVGDIHTHPIKVKRSDKGWNPCAPSDPDIKDIIKEYENGNLSPNKPFIFCIAARLTDEDTTYSFYRLIKQSDKYTVEQIEKY